MLARRQKVHNYKSLILSEYNATGSKLIKIDEKNVPLWENIHFSESKDDFLVIFIVTRGASLVGCFIRH